MEREYLKAKELMQKLKISQALFYKLIHQEGFPKIKILGGYRFVEADVKNYLERQK